MQRTHLRHLLRQMSHDSSFLFHSHSVLIEGIFGHSFARQHFSNCCLLYFFIYIVVLNTTYSFWKTVPWQLFTPYIPPDFTSACVCPSSLPACTCCVKADYAIITYKRYVVNFSHLKYFRRRSTLWKFSTQKIPNENFIQRKVPNLWYVILYNSAQTLLIFQSLQLIQHSSLADSMSPQWHMKTFRLTTRKASTNFY